MGGLGGRLEKPMVIGAGCWELGGECWLAFTAVFDEPLMLSHLFAQWPSNPVDCYTV